MLSCNSMDSRGHPLLPPEDEVGEKEIVVVWHLLPRQTGLSLEDSVDSRSSRRLPGEEAIRCRLENNETDDLPLCLDGPAGRPPSDPADSSLPTT